MSKRFFRLRECLQEKKGGKLKNLDRNYLILGLKTLKFNIEVKLEVMYAN